MSLEGNGACDESVESVIVVMVLSSVGGVAQRWRSRSGRAVVRWEEDDAAGCNGGGRACSECRRNGCWTMKARIEQGVQRRRRRRARVPVVPMVVGRGMFA